MSSEMPTANDASSGENATSSNPQSAATLHEKLQRLSAREAALRKELEAIDEERKSLLEQINAASSISESDVVATCVLSAEACQAAIVFFEGASADAQARMLSSIMEEASKLMADSHGYMLVQKIVDKFSSRHLETLLDHLSDDKAHFEQIALTPHGVSVIQRLSEAFHAAGLQDRYFSLIAKHINVIARDVNGRHVVARALSNTRDPNSVFDAMLAHCCEMGVSRHGCCIIQKVLETCEAETKERLVNAMLQHVLAYVQDSFGNYLVQALLDLNLDHVTKRVVQALLHNVAPLACNKFASNVVEKCFRLASDDIRQLFIDELTDPMWLSRLVQDCYANYVVQTALTTCSPEQFNQLHSAIRPQFATLRHSPYGSKIEAKIVKRVRDLHRIHRRKEQRGGGNNSSEGASVDGGHQPHHNNGGGGGLMAPMSASGGGHQGGGLSNGGGGHNGGRGGHHAGGNQRGAGGHHHQHHRQQQHGVGEITVVSGGDVQHHHHSQDGHHGGGGHFAQNRAMPGGMGAGMAASPFSAPLPPSQQGFFFAANGQGNANGAQQQIVVGGAAARNQQQVHPAQLGHLNAPQQQQQSLIFAGLQQQQQQQFLGQQLPQQQQQQLRTQQLPQNQQQQLAQLQHQQALAQQQLTLQQQLSLLAAAGANPGHLQQHQQQQLNFAPQQGGAGHHGQQQQGGQHSQQQSHHQHQQQHGGHHHGHHGQQFSHQPQSNQQQQHGGGGAGAQQQQTYLNGDGGIWSM